MVGSVASCTHATDGQAGAKDAAAKAGGGSAGGPNAKGGTSGQTASGGSPVVASGGSAGLGGSSADGTASAWPSWDSSTGLAAPELLYDFGRNGNGKGLRGIIADEQSLYWLQDSNDLSKASKVPGGTAQVIVPMASATNANQGWVMEKDFLYWDAASRIRRLDKRTGQVTDFPLDKTYGTLIMVSDASNLYLAEPGCVTMMTMDKATGALRDIERKPASTYRGGAFSIALSSSHVYCSGGAGGVLYRRPVTGGAVTEALRLKDDNPPYLPQIGSMLVIGTTMYLARSYGGELPGSHYVATLDLVPDPLPAPVDQTTRIARTNGSPFEYDAARKMLYWLGGPVLIYSLPTHELRQAGVESFTVENGPTGYLASDADYLYWHHRDPYVRVYRQRKLDPKQ